MQVFLHFLCEAAWLDLKARAGETLLNFQARIATLGAFPVKYKWKTPIPLANCSTVLNVSTLLCEGSNRNQHAFFLSFGILLFLYGPLSYRHYLKLCSIRGATASNKVAIHYFPFFCACLLRELEEAAVSSLQIQ